jgi:DNA-binding NtrC family response regulator
MNILVVDDSPSVRATLGYILPTLGHFSMEAASIQEARVFLAGMGFDLVMSDYELGDGSGTEFLAELARSNPEMRRLLMSGRKDPGGHGNPFLRKPFDTEGLKATLDSIFQTA